LIHWFINCEIN